MPYVSFADRYEQQEAYEEGRREGLREGLLASLDALLTLRFGQSGIETLPELNQIHDPEQLFAILNVAKNTAIGLADIRNMIPRASARTP